MAWTIWFIAGGIFAALSVIMGAFAAHALKTRLAPENLAWLETGVRYQMYHALALLALGFLAMRVENLYVRLAGVAFILGTVVFSGSLYLLSFTDNRSFGMITPIGGLGFVLGWLFLVLSVIRPV